jgi:hypothetical protein
MLSIFSYVDVAVHLLLLYLSACWLVGGGLCLYFGAPRLSLAGKRVYVQNSNAYSEQPNLLDLVGIPVNVSRFGSFK